MTNMPKIVTLHFSLIGVVLLVIGGSLATLAALNTNDWTSSIPRIAMALVSLVAVVFGSHFVK